MGFLVYCLRGRFDLAIIHPPPVRHDDSRTYPASFPQLQALRRTGGSEMLKPSILLFDLALRRTGGSEKTSVLTGIMPTALRRTGGSEKFGNGNPPC